MAAGNDVTALYLYSEPNSILMSEYATAQVGRPTETQIQKTNLEETLRSMVAVSYTHLDVYKRQSYNCPFI